MRKQHAPGDILADRLLMKSRDDALGMKKSLIRKRELHILSDISQLIVFIYHPLLVCQHRRRFLCVFQVECLQLLEGWKKINANLPGDGLRGFFTVNVGGQIARVQNQNPDLILLNYPGCKGVF